jgi:A/G-specific adenine glycosylase
MPIPPRVHPGLHDRVLGWYARHGRPLAFRNTTDPWAILVSEVMAQQTQAARAAEAWSGFMAAYPTPAALATASPAAVLRAWRGLGYNRRALALRDAAIRIIEDHDGAVPGDPETLRRLPGVGPYTARAVATLAFGVPVGPVDTNVRRVLGRAFFGSPPSDRELQAFADEIVPAAAPGAWTHALMDLGARVCKPRTPRCDACPLAADCHFAARPASAAGPTERRGTDVRPFVTTRRWLRGRILDRLRDAVDGQWVAFDVPLGSHAVPAIAAELRRLAAEGLLEQHPSSAGSARLIA